MSGPVYDVIGFGVVAVDDLVYVDRFPEPDGKMAVLERRREGGGLAGTALVAAARLGARTAWCGVLGEDELSRYSLTELEREGVDVSRVIRRPGADPCASVIIVVKSTGQRSILSGIRGVTPFPPGEIGPELIGKCRVLFVDHTCPATAIRAAGFAREAGIPVVGDVESLGDPGVSELVPLIDHLIVGKECASGHTGVRDPAGMVRALAGSGRACTAVTAGADGVWYSAGTGEVRRVTGHRVAVADTTGCGDVFHGAYAAFLAFGKDVSAAIEAANAAAAIKATKPGGRSGIPVRSALEAFLARQGGD
jgi:ribokinase